MAGPARLDDRLVADRPGRGHPRLPAHRLGAERRPRADRLRAADPLRRPLRGRVRRPLRPEEDPPRLGHPPRRDRADDPARVRRAGVGHRHVGDVRAALPGGDGSPVLRSGVGERPAGGRLGGRAQPGQLVPGDQLVRLDGRRLRGGGDPVLDRHPPPVLHRRATFVVSFVLVLAGSGPEDGVRGDDVHWRRRRQPEERRELSVADADPPLVAAPDRARPDVVRLLERAAAADGDQGARCDRVRVRAAGRTDVGRLRRRGAVHGEASAIACQRAPGSSPASSPWALRCAAMASHRTSRSRS